MSSLCQALCWASGSQMQPLHKGKQVLRKTFQDHNIGYIWGWCTCTRGSIHFSQDTIVRWDSKNGQKRIDNQVPPPTICTSLCWEGCLQPMIPDAWSLDLVVAQSWGWDHRLPFLFMLWSSRSNIPHPLASEATSLPLIRKARRQAE